MTGLNEFNYNVVQEDSSRMRAFVVSTTRRLNTWAADKTLYANNDFSLSPEEGEKADGLLRWLLSVAGLNNSGVEIISVTPFSVRMVGGALQHQNVEEMFLRASRVAGLKAVRISN